MAQESFHSIPANENLRQKREAEASACSLPGDPQGVTSGDPGGRQNSDIDLEARYQLLCQTNEALEEAHNRYLDLYDLSPVGYVTLTQDEQIAEINLTAAELFGCERDGLIGRILTSLLVADDAERWQRFFADQVHHGGNQNAEFTVARAAGDTVCVRLDCLCVRRDNMGLAIHVALTDISEKKRVETAMQESEARYRAVFDNARNGLVVVDDKTRNFIEANDAFLTMIGAKREQLTQLHISDILPCPDRPKVIAAFEELAVGATALAENIQIQRLDGRILHVDVNGGPFVQDGKIRILGEFHDITARKRAEDALREQAAFFRLITENLDGFVAVLDVEGRRIYNSPSYVRFLGEGKLSGSDSFAEIYPDDQERVKQAFRETVATGVGKHLEYRLTMIDGGVRIMESRGGVIRDLNGNVNRVIVVSNDITERREAEQRIQHQAHYDALTQLPNRLTFSDRLHQAIAASKRNSRYGALMFLDLDHFKPLNDAYGHEAGDCLLIQVAARVSDCVREIDTVARFGGDEFVILLEDLDVDHGRAEEAATTVAEKILATVAEPYQIETKTDGAKLTTIEHHCTASIGVVLFLNDNLTEKELLNMADREMYRVKENGRNGVSLMH